MEKVEAFFEDLQKGEKPMSGSMVDGIFSAIKTYAGLQGVENTKSLRSDKVSDIIKVMKQEYTKRYVLCSSCILSVSCYC